MSHMRNCTDLNIGEAIAVQMIKNKRGSLKDPPLPLDLPLAILRVTYYLSASQQGICQSEGVYEEPDSIGLSLYV